MLAAAKRQARTQCQALRETARDQAQIMLTAEINRLSALQDLNKNVRPEEINHLLETRSLTLEAIDQADIRLDSIRVIVAA